MRMLRVRGTAGGISIPAGFCRGGTLFFPTQGMRQSSSGGFERRYRGRLLLDFGSFVGEQRAQFQFQCVVCLSVERQQSFVRFQCPSREGIGIVMLTQYSKKMNETELQPGCFRVERGFMSRFGRRSDRMPRNPPGMKALRSGIRPPYLTFLLAARGGSSGRELNVFTEGLVIDGNVVSEQASCSAARSGRIDCRSDVEISGEITGDVRGAQCAHRRGQCPGGDIVACEMLSIDRSRIRAALTATHARINNLIRATFRCEDVGASAREAITQGQRITAAGPRRGGGSVDERTHHHLREAQEPSGTSSGLFRRPGD